MSGLDLLYAFDKSIFIYFRLNEKLFPTDGQFTIIEDKRFFFLFVFGLLTLFLINRTCEDSVTFRIFLTIQV